jgi:hypothetical protein
MCRATPAVAHRRGGAAAAGRSQLLPGKNIYLQAYEIAQIDLFDLLPEAFPPIPQSYAIANQHLAARAAGLDSAALLDIGVGKGSAAARVAATLAAAPGRLRRLRIVALDPLRASLLEAQAAIEAAAPSLPFARRGGAAARCWSSAASRRCCRTAVGGRRRGGDQRRVHAAPHGHAPGDQELRTQLLRRLAGLRPRVLTLIEPNANHDTELLTRRVHSCWEHFGTVFDLIDRSDG